MSDNKIGLTTSHQKLVLSGLMKNQYIFSLIREDMNDGYFNDSSCRIIYKSICNFYDNYDKLPNEIELISSIDDNYIELGPSKEEVQKLASLLYNEDEVEENFLVDKASEMIKKVRVSRALNRSFERLQSGTSVNNEDLLNDLVDALDVSYDRSGIFCLNDISALDAERRKAVGDNQHQSIIKSILPSVNQSLQYKGYQKGTLNLIVSPPGCFTGDTKIMTLDGSHTLEELYESDGEITIFNCTSDGMIISDVADSIYLSDYTDEIIEVELDNGFIIKCTYDHPFMMKDGSYKSAENLNLGDLVMYSRSIKSIVRVKLREKVPVYGVVDAGKYHNYALDVGDDHGVFVSNTGKTSYLVNEGAYAAQQGFNVVHVFLGDMVGYDGFVRYMANMSGKLQDEIIAMPLEKQDSLIIELNNAYNNVLSRLNILCYGSGELTVDNLIEVLKKEQERLNVHFDDVIIDYADNFQKDNTNLYVEGGYIYDRLALFARLNSSVVMVASQPKMGYWKDEIIPLEGASESSKKQHVVDLLMTFNLVSRTANIGTVFIPKVRRGTSGRFIRVETHWETCRIEEISENEYTLKKGQLDL